MTEDPKKSIIEAMVIKIPNKIVKKGITLTTNSFKSKDNEGNLE